jgi:hypothetical protein
MASTYTTNKVIEKPGNGDYVDTWNVPANSDFDIIDQAFGGTTSLNATSGSATLTSTQYRSLMLFVSGAMTASVTYTIPSGKGGQWIVRNTTTDSSGGPWSVTIASGGGGSSVTINRNTNTTIFCDGTNVYSLGVAAPGTDTQVIFNSSGSLSGSSNLTFNGTSLSAFAVSTNTLNAPSGTLAVTGDISGSGSITAAGNVTAYSDASLKTNIETITDALDKVMKLRGVSYTMINSGEAGIGVIAQETREVLPQVVKDNNGILSVAYANMVGVLIEAVKELSAKVERLESK